MKVRQMQSWNLHPVFFRIRDWVPDFTPYKINSTLVHVWVHMYNLPIKYWHAEMLVGIARSVGTPLKIDGNSMHGTVGHYARVLIEVDMAQILQSSVMIDCGDASLFIDFHYGDLPSSAVLVKWWGMLQVNVAILRRNIRLGFLTRKENLSQVQQLWKR
ncbi:hypothetical protein C2S52_015021 [Perilla frutescens var. hirtella]|nr:hypothetical protein C2S52_015021 [Perilla frutescens var. hirtella]KAH6816159.1 hypothetical protein C2S51_020979 [Perilla frutescens var. frutescens]